MNNSVIEKLSEKCANNMNEGFYQAPEEDVTKAPVSNQPEPAPAQTPVDPTQNNSVAKPKTPQQIAFEQQLIANVSQQITPQMLSAAAQGDTNAMMAIVDVSSRAVSGVGVEDAALNNQPQAPMQNQTPFIPSPNNEQDTPNQTNQMNPKQNQNGTYENQNNSTEQQIVNNEMYQQGGQPQPGNPQAAPAKDNQFGTPEAVPTSNTPADENKDEDKPEPKSAKVVPEVGAEGEVQNATPEYNVDNKIKQTILQLADLINRKKL